MGASEKFCLKWNDFETNISVAFRELREEKDFFDVTLACDDSQVQAHKVILSACSPFFRQILRRNPHQHPLLYLKGVKYKELLSVLNFMYQGEVNVAQEELNSFLAVAEDLRVKGLTQSNAESGDRNKGAKVETKNSSVRPREPPDRDSSAPPVKRPRPAPPVIPPSPIQQTNNRHATSSGYKQDQEEEEDDIQEVVPVKSEPREPAPSNTAVVSSHSVAADAAAPYEDVVGQGGGQVALEEEYQDDSYDYAEYGEGYEDSSGMIDPNTGMPVASSADGNKDVIEIVDVLGRRVFQCPVCPHVSDRKANTRLHIETKHQANEPVACLICHKISPNMPAYNKHCQRFHRNLDHK